MAQWVPQNSGTLKGLTSVFFTNDATGYIVGGSNGHIILKTNNGGTNWDSLSTGISVPFLMSIHFPTTDTGYTGGSNHNIFKTTDAGATWTTLDAGHEYNFAIHFTNANTGYVAGGGNMTGGGISKTTDGGITWQFSPLGWQFCICFPNANTGYSVGTDGQVWSYGTINKTNDGGATWTTIFQLVNVQLNSVYFIDSDKGYVVGDDGTVLKTTDGGINWTTLNSGTTINLTSVCFTDPYTGYIVGDNGTILKSNNAGLTWENQISGTLNNLRSVCFTDPSTGYVVGDNGTILKTTNGGQVGISENDFESKSLKIYPNPSKNTITVETLIAGDTRISLLNLSNQQIMERPVSESKTQINISSLPPGVYIVKLRNRNATEVEKIVKE